MTKEQLHEITKRLDKVIELLTPETEPAECSRCAMPEPLGPDGLCADCHRVVNEEGEATP